MNDEFLNAVEAAAFLKITKGTLYNLVQAREVPCYQLFGRRSLRFKKSELVKLFKFVPNGSKKIVR